MDYPINGAHRGNDHRVVLSGPIWNGPGSEDDHWSGKTGRSVYTGEFTWEEQCNEYFCIDVLDRAKVLTVRTYVNDRLHVAADYDSPHRGLLISGRGVEMQFLGNDHDNTRVFAGHLDDQLLGRGGDDELAGNGGDDLIDGGAGYDELVGNGGDDRLSGDHGQDAIFGGAGSDRLSGGEASDRLRGGTGTDLIRGGAGSDLFLFKSLAEAGSGPGRDGHPGLRPDGRPAGPPRHRRRCRPRRRPGVRPDRSRRLLGRRGRALPAPRCGVGRRGRRR